MKGLALARRHLPVNAAFNRNPWLNVTEEYVLFPQAASPIFSKMPIQGTNTVLACPPYSHILYCIKKYVKCLHGGQK